MDEINRISREVLTKSLPSIDTPYIEYIQSDQWREQSAQTIKSRGGRCQLCDRDVWLGVHHLTYERMGGELPEDLSCLCVLCHSACHPAKLIRHGQVGCVCWRLSRDAFNVPADPFGDAKEYVAHSEVKAYLLIGARPRKQVLIVSSGISEYPRSRSDGGRLGLLGEKPFLVEVVDFADSRERDRIVGLVEPSSMHDPSAAINEIFRSMSAVALTHE